MKNTDVHEVWTILHLGIGMTSIISAIEFPHSFLDHPNVNVLECYSNILNNLLGPVSRIIYGCRVFKNSTQQIFWNVCTRYSRFFLFLWLLMVNYVYVMKQFIDKFRFRWTWYLGKVIQNFIWYVAVFPFLHAHIT